MADNPIPEVKADLPEDWGYEQTVAPEGASVGLPEQYGYNYLMKKVNECARTLNQIVVAMGQITPADMVTADGGGVLFLPVALGGGPYEIEFTEEEAEEYALKSDLSAYAKLKNPTLPNNIIVGGNAAAGTDETFSEGTTGSIIAGAYNRVNPGASSVLCVGYDNYCTSGCVVLGESCEAHNGPSMATGFHTRSEGLYSISGGMYTWAKALELVFGSHNVPTDSPDAGLYTGALFILGNGASDMAKSNAFRVSKAGQVYGTGAYNSSGADYAEIYEWLDGNTGAEDRVGRFVVLDGENIRLASPEDDIRDILGIISGNPSVVGDYHDDQWRGMYLRDIFGRPVYEDAAEEDPEHPGQMVTVHRWKLNPSYDPEQRYIPQSKRPEKAAVGLLGKLVMVDDGTCEVNGWCAAGPGGIAVKSKTRTRFRCMSRLDGTHIRVNIMLQ